MNITTLILPAILMLSQSPAQTALPDELAEAVIRYGIGFYQDECGSRISTKYETPTIYYIAVGEQYSDPSPKVLVRIQGMRLKPYSEYSGSKQRTQLSAIRQVVIHWEKVVYPAHDILIASVKYERADRPADTVRSAGPTFELRSGQWHFVYDDLNKVI